MKSYEVTGTTAYRGYQPGERFKADLTDEQEQRAVQRGSIRVVTAAGESKSGKGKRANG